MIIKFFEKEKIDKVGLDFYLVYGDNEGQKEDILQCVLKNYNGLTNKYDEKEFLESKNEILSSLLNKSFFENNKAFIIFRSTDKSLGFIEEMLEKKITDTKIILLSERLDKKSKIRNFFEKSKSTGCIPVYPDDNNTLSKIATSRFKENQISISRECIDMIVQKSSGDRNNLKNEIDKIIAYLDKNKIIKIDEIYKIVNLSENYSVSELVDNCLSKNLNRTIKILNENNYSTEDCILIIRTLISKSKRLSKILKDYEKNKNLEQVISTHKPPIFWKDKDAVKTQVKAWSSIKINDLVFKINDLELLIKKNSSRSLNILYDFLIETAKAKI
tara:strand:- start:504 stop:1493 length:990 start_codon:yes stop_codon:yes gene_type:complete